MQTEHSTASTATTDDAQRTKINAARRDRSYDPSGLPAFRAGMEGSAIHTGLKPGGPVDRRVQQDSLTVQATPNSGCNRETRDGSDLTGKDDLLHALRGGQIESPICRPRLSFVRPAGDITTSKGEGEPKMSKVIRAGADDFEAQVLKSDLPVMVDFYADWCMPCRMLAPSLDDLSVKFDGRARVVKVNVDDAQDIAGRYGVSSIPALYVFVNGEVVSSMVGMRPLPELEQVLEAATSGSQSPSS
ncbi:MAG: thioredoxin [Planctomycetota bacterium]